MINRKGWLTISLCILLSVTVVVLMFEDSTQIELESEVRYLPPVSVIKIQPQDNKGVIEVFAEVEPRWEVTLNAQVSGEITKVFDEAFAGKRVNKGTRLIDIEGSPYQADLDDAAHALSEAKLMLLQEQKRSAQALRDWQRSGIAATPSELVLNKPQLDVAQKAVRSAESRLNAALKNHAYTQITAPFSGLVTVRHVSVGQSVAEGDALLRIVHETQQEIVVALSKRQWNLLVENWHDQLASARNSFGREIAQPRMKRGGGFLDPETRQYKLFLEVDGSEQVLPGDFVRVALPGRTASDSLALPESALTRDGLVWYLDNEDRLRSFTATVLFHHDGQIIINTPTAENIGKHYPADWRIATTPLASFLAGKQVNPVTVGRE